MSTEFNNELSYIKAKKKVKQIKGFYIHLIVYIFLTGLIVFSLVKSGYSYLQAFSNFGVYSTPLFWGVGVFFHWLGVFGFNYIGFGDKWEEKKIKEIMDKDDF